MAVLLYAQKRPLNTDPDASREAGYLQFRVFLYLLTLCMRDANVLTILCGCTGSSKPSLLDDRIRTKNLFYHSYIKFNVI